MSTGAYLAGELAKWPAMDRMASILQRGGLRVSVGRYSIKLYDFPHFSFEEYGGDLGDPQIEADADDAETLAVQAKRVSDALTNAGLIHRFEIYQDGTEEMTDYFHHGWPLTNVAYPGAAEGGDATRIP